MVLLDLLLSGPFIAATLFQFISSSPGCISMYIYIALAMSSWVGIGTLACDGTSKLSFVTTKGCYASLTGVAGNEHLTGEELSNIDISPAGYLIKISSCTVFSFIYSLSYIFEFFHYFYNFDQNKIKIFYLNTKAVFSNIKITI